MSAPMRVLTVRQPWAWAIIHGGKNVENRARNIAGTYRGAIAIHVAGRYAEDGLDRAALSDACDAWCETNGCAQHPWFSGIGKIIGVVDLVGVHEATPDGRCCGNNTGWGHPDGWHLELSRPRPLDRPIPYTGALGLRRLDPSAETGIRDQLGCI